MKLHRYRTLLCAACCFALALVAAAPGRAIGATMTITTIDDLQKIGNDPGFPLDGTYVLGSDIDASATSTWNSGAGFAPIGASSPYFTGSFDGQGHVIRNLFINRPGTDDVGLFGDVESGGLIKNLGLDNATVTGRNEVGILAGYVDYVAIVNCHSKGTVTGVEYIGGLVGESDAGDIASCYSTAAVSGTDWSTGGLVGYNEYTNITSCYATGAVSGYGEVGGLLGYNEYSSIFNSYATGAVTGTYEEVGGLVGYNDYGSISSCSSTGAVSGTDYVGGLVGDNEYTNISDSHSTGAVTGTSYYVGGLVGYNEYDSITNCYATGAVTGGDSEVGGLVGENEYSSITNCYATGAVTGTGAHDYIGGLVGYAEYGGITNCYATGVVTGEGQEVGGLVGENYDNGITMSYSTGAVTGTGSYVGGLVGYHEDGGITMSYSTGAVTGKNDEVGGLVGYIYYGAISNCFSTSAVSDNSDYVGGLVGYNYYGVISTSYSTGTATGSSDVGGLLGYEDGGFVSASFWDNQTSGLATSAGGTAKTTAKMKTKATFTDAGWDFTTIWGIVDGQTYPALLLVNNPLPSTIVAASDNYTTRRNTPLAVAAANGVLKNDTDPNNKTLTAVLVSATTSGTVALNPDGSFVYIPNKNFRGTDTFIYTANNGTEDSAPATVTITVGRKKLCPAVKLYGEKSAEVRLLRTYRDKVLAKTAAGRIAIDMYYNLAPMADTMIDNSPYLGQKTRSIIDMLLPSIQRSMER